MTNSSSHKIRVAVLFGGRSGEHEISLQSAASVIRNLDTDKFEIIPIGIDKAGQWRLGSMKSLHVEGKSLKLPEFDGKAIALPSPKAKGVLPASPNIELQTLSENTDVQNFDGIDVVFPILHGTMGEDGTVQGLLELAEIAYVGPGVLGSAIGMDKDIAKRLARLAGVPIADYLSLKQGEWQQQPKYWQSQVASTLGYPVFVKPANSGSSVGIHKVKNAAGLAEAVADAFLYDTKILIEKAVNAREIELSALENANYGAEPLISIPGEIIPSHEYYSYEAKYLDTNGAALRIPAQLSSSQIVAAQELARKIFSALECEGMARIDLFLDKGTGEFYFNEINTIPGFTQISMYPKLWGASGLAYQDLLTALIELALARHQRKHQLKREWAV